MAREKMFDPQFQKAFTEAIHTENRIRMKFHLENAGRLQKNVIESDEEESDSEEEIEKATSAPAPKRVTFTVKAEEEEAREAPFETSWPASKPKSSITKMADPPSAMRYVDKATKLMLYQGVSHEEEGRLQYLRARKLIPPEVRYRFPVCSSWEYGWQYGLQQDEPAHSPYGRRQIIKQSFYRPNDPQLQPKD